MNARRKLIAALSEDSLGGIATLADVAHAEQLADAYRAEVLREAKVEVIAWLAKKAHEDTPVFRLADKVDRGAIRIFLNTEEKATPTGATVTPDFFQPGRTYHSRHDGYTAPELIITFRVEHVTRHPDRGHLRAIGWIRTGEPGTGWHGDFRDESEYDVDGWTDITGGGETQ